MKIRFGWEENRFGLKVVNKHGLTIAGLTLSVSESKEIREAMAYGKPGDVKELDGHVHESSTAGRDGLSEIDHLLICLGEEASEIAQAVSKALRFGLDDNFTDTSPRKMIWLELNDLAGVIAELAQRDVIGAEPDHALVTAKREKLAKMLAYARDKGTLRRDEIAVE
jgi:hypothetical protein